MILKELNLTRPEKAAVISAMCFFETGGQPLMGNIDSYLIRDIKEILLYPGMKPLLLLICDNVNIVISLYEKMGIENDT